MMGGVFRMWASACRIGRCLLAAQARARPFVLLNRLLPVCLWAGGARTGTVLSLVKLLRLSSQQPSFLLPVAAAERPRTDMAAAHEARSSVPVCLGRNLDFQGIRRDCVEISLIVIYVIMFFSKKCALRSSNSTQAFLPAKLSFLGVGKGVCCEFG